MSTSPIRLSQRCARSSFKAFGFEPSGRCEAHCATHALTTFRRICSDDNATCWQAKVNDHQRHDVSTRRVRAISQVHVVDACHNQPFPNFLPCFPSKDAARGQNSVLSQLSASETDAGCSRGTMHLRSALSRKWSTVVSGTAENTLAMQCKSISTRSLISKPTPMRDNLSFST